MKSRFLLRGASAISSRYHPAGYAALPFPLWLAFCSSYKDVSLGLASESSTRAFLLEESDVDYSIPRVVFEKSSL